MLTFYYGGLIKYWTHLSSNVPMITRAGINSSIMQRGNGDGKVSMNESLSSFCLGESYQRRGMMDWKKKICMEYNRQVNMGALNLELLFIRNILKMWKEEFPLYFSGLRTQLIFMRMQVRCLASHSIQHCYKLWHSLQIWLGSSAAMAVA